MTVDDNTPVAQVFIQGDFGDAQPLAISKVSSLLLLVKRLGHNGRALGFLREFPAAAPNAAPRPHGIQAGVGSLPDEFPLKLGQRGKQVEHQPPLRRSRVDALR